MPTSGKPRYMRGATPAQPAWVIQQQQAAWLRLTRAMMRDVRAELRGLPWHDVQPVEVRQAADLGIVGDALPFADIAAKMMARLIDRWGERFNVEGDEIAAKMTAGALKVSNNTLSRSMREMGERLTLSVGPQLHEQLSASAKEAASLIKRIAADYLPKVAEDVYRSISSGDGLAELMPKLAARNVKVKNWAYNVARDQTRKAYQNVNRVRMVEAGLPEYEWVHSGGSNQPREYHLHQWPAGLNGGIFRWDDPPIADPRTGERAHPGQLPYCGCIARPVFKLPSKGKDNAE